MSPDFACIRGVGSESDAWQKHRQCLLLARTAAISAGRGSDTQRGDAVDLSPRVDCVRRLRPDEMRKVRLLLARALRVIVLRLFRVSVHIDPATWDQIRSGNVIVCANHVSHLDGLIVAMASPVLMTYAIDTSYSRDAWYGRVGLALGERLGLCRVVPLGANAPFGLRRLLQALRQQHAVMIFPTGTIVPGATVRPGVTWLQARTGATVVQLQIRGAEKSRLFAKCGARWWPPIAISVADTGAYHCGPTQGAAEGAMTIDTAGAALQDVPYEAAHD